jgi:Flp pilus assembly pilin Flp
MFEHARPQGRTTTRRTAVSTAEATHVRSAFRGLGSLVARMCRDESANALPEYAIILATLSIIAIVSFQLLGNTSTNVVTTNQNNFINSATMSYQH